MLCVIPWHPQISWKKLVKSDKKNPIKLLFFDLNWGVTDPLMFVSFRPSHIWDTDTSSLYIHHMSEHVRTVIILSDNQTSQWEIRYQWRSRAGKTIYKWWILHCDVCYVSFTLKAILVGGWATPLKNMSSSVGMIIPNIWKNKTCSKPPTSITCWIYPLKIRWFPILLLVYQRVP